MRREIVYLRHPAADEKEARRAVAWIAERFRFEPEVPVHPEELRERRLAAQRAAVEERRRERGVEELGAVA